MPTIDQVKKMKKDLEKTIFEAAKKFEEVGATISYIDIQREPYDYKESMRPEPVSVGGSADRPLIGVRIDLRIDLD